MFNKKILFLLFISINILQGAAIAASCPENNDELHGFDQLTILTAATVMPANNNFWASALQFCSKALQLQHNASRQLKSLTGTLPKYEEIHELSVQQKLSERLKTLDQKQMGSSARFVDEAILQAIQDSHEPALKNVLLAVIAQDIPNSAFPEQTRQQIESFLKQCSEQKKKTIIDLITSYEIEVYEDMQLIHRFTTSEHISHEKYTKARLDYIAVQKEITKTVNELTQKLQNFANTGKK